ncbi:hypothetical protein PIROE2DRAFT_7391 [Piromyces sp. E2]|nr:hypothetical protein PIROE2DRAFT_7391 [Piromyces sp. E2]|eukprot:OUM65551.1 hypothetical protein PIROE2DRAFT_7391 [Piromyces sp. E2]
MILKSSLIKSIIFVGTIIITKIYSSCIPLINSKSCPGFQGYSIDTTNGIFPLSSHPRYTDVDSFDSYIDKYSEFLAKKYVHDLAVSSTCNQQEMENYAVSNLRYLKTYACNFILNSNENSCPNNPKKVCKSVCTDFLSSFQKLVNKFNTCLNKECSVKLC